MQRLPPGMRQIFVLHDIEGYKHDEIAAMLGIAQGTSKSQLHRVRMVLRKYLERLTMTMTGMTDSWTDRLSEYVDGELDAATRERSRRISRHARSVGRRAMSW